MSPYRSRSINWGLLLQPTMEGLQTEAQASSKLGSMIAGAGGEIGAGFTRKRTEAESKRRFDIESARQDRELALREKTHAEDLQLRRDALDEKAAERQANQTAMLDSVEFATTMALGGDPQAAQALAPLSDALGGPEATQAKLANRPGPMGSFAPRTSQYDSITNSRIDRVPDLSVPSSFWMRPESPKSVMSEGGAAPTTAAAPAARPVAAPATPAAPAGMPLRPTASAPVAATPNPAVGEMGVADSPAEELAVKADEAAKRQTLAESAMREARKALAPNGLKRPEDRAKAEKAYNDAMTAWIAAGAERTQYVRRASQAAKREAIAGSVESRRIAETDNEIQKAKEHRDTLIAWSEDPEGARNRFSQADLSNPDTRSRLAVEYEQQKAKHTAAEAARAAKALPAQGRAVMEAYVESDKSLNIPDASGLPDDVLKDAYKKVVAKMAASPETKRKAENDAARLDLAKTGAADRAENSDERLAIAKRTEQRNRMRDRLNYLEGQIATWDKTGKGDTKTAQFAPGTPEHKAYWDAQAERADLAKRLGEVGADESPAAPTAPAAETPWQKAQRDPTFATLTDAQKEALRKRLGG